MTAVVPLATRVEQARQAAAGQQWRMAGLYAGRALQLVAIERAECRKAMGIANRRLRSQGMGKGLGYFFTGLVEIAQETIQPVIDAYAPLVRAAVAATESTRADFVLHNDERLLDAMYAVQAGEVLTGDQRRFL